MKREEKKMFLVDAGSNHSNQPRCQAGVEGMGERGVPGGYRAFFVPLGGGGPQGTTPLPWASCCCICCSSENNSNHKIGLWLGDYQSLLFSLASEDD